MAGKSWSSLILATALTLAVALPAQAVPKGDEIERHLSTRAYLINSQTLRNSINMRTCDSAAFNAALRKLDPYASYTDAQRFTKLKADAGISGGVGMDLIWDRQNVLRCIPFRHSPADENGIEYKDRLMAVDGRDVQKLTPEVIAGLIRGPVGSDVELTVKKENGSTVTLSIERTQGNYSDLEKTGGAMETIRIYRFSPGLSDKLKALAGTLKTPADMQIFLDLRGNTGGVLEEGAKAAGLFLHKDDLLYRVRDPSGIREVRNPEDGPLSNRKVILLTDELTASAAELMIAALGLREGVAIYGTTTAGKGYIQDVFPLSDGAVLKFTTSELLFPESDEGWQDRGLEPDLRQQ